MVKPDHLGDFVLSIPALRAIHRRLGHFDLFTPPENHFLSRYFLPDVTPLPMKLRHLTKGAGGVAFSAYHADLARYPLVIFLRDDQVIREAASDLPGRTIHPRGSNGLHETLIQKRAIMPVVGGYSRTELFGGDGGSWPKDVRCVGICLSAGFFSNRLPFLQWLRVARMLQGRRIRIKIIGGPMEADDVRLMVRALRLDGCDAVIGGFDLDGFFKAIDACDVVVGTDSGTLHLVSVRRPVMGIFTSSPWRRFAPFGARNRVICSVVPCSPCAQFSRDALNGCLSQECAALLEPRDICDAIFVCPPFAEAMIGPTTRLVVGPSHASPAYKGGSSDSHVGKRPNDYGV